MQIRITFASGREWVVIAQGYHHLPHAKFLTFIDAYGKTHALPSVVAVSQTFGCE